MPSASKRALSVSFLDTLTQAQRVGLVMLDAHGGLAMPPVAPTPVLAAAPAKGAQAAARAFARRHWLPLGAGLGVLVLAGALAFAMEPHRRVRRLLAEGRGPEALQVIDDAGAAALDWGMKQLKGAALHQVGRHDEEWVVVHALPDTEHPEPLAVEALADDYGHDEAPRLRKLLGELPRTHVLPVLQGLAKDGSGWAAWRAALRRRGVRRPGVAAVGALRARAGQPGVPHPRAGGQAVGRAAQPRGGGAAGAAQCCCLRRFPSMRSPAPSRSRRNSRRNIRKSRSTASPRPAMETCLRFLPAARLFTPTRRSVICCWAHWSTRRNRNNVTETRLQKLTAIKFADLPFEHAIKLVRGNGARKMAVFEDPNCGYCKKFEQDINAMENITAYIFAYPILAASSAEKSKAVWCSPDRLKAWQDLMLRDRAPAAKGTCDNPIDKIVQLGKNLRVTGTPTTFFEDGECISGVMDKDRMEARLTAAKAAMVADAKK